MSNSEYAAAGHEKREFREPDPLGGDGAYLDNGISEHQTRIMKDAFGEEDAILAKSPISAEPREAKRTSWLKLLPVTEESIDKIILKSSLQIIRPRAIAVEIIDYYRNHWDGLKPFPSDFQEATDENLIILFSETANLGFLMAARELQSILGLRGVKVSLRGAKVSFTYKQLLLSAEHFCQKSNPDMIKMLLEDYLEFLDAEEITKPDQQSTSSKILVLFERAKHNKIMKLTGLIRKTSAL